MPRTIRQAFDDFHKKIRTSKTEAAAAKDHRASIEDCLKSNFGLIRFTRIGSFGNGTNINGYSDVDYLTCLPTDQLTQTSNASLTKVRDALNRRFTSTNIKTSNPTVVCPFGTVKSEQTELVIADYVGVSKDFKVYEISDGNNGWMRISPDAHNYYVSQVDRKHNGKVKPLVRFIKAWKYYNEVPISSFFIEMFVARYADNEDCIVYDIDIKRILCKLKNSDLASIHDPSQVTGIIKPCSSDASKQNALSKLNTAATRAQKAIDLSTSDDSKGAFYFWDLLYNGKFPGYYL